MNLYNPVGMKMTYIKSCHRNTKFHFRVPSVFPWPKRVFAGVNFSRSQIKNRQWSSYENHCLSKAMKIYFISLKPAAL